MQIIEYSSFGKIFPANSVACALGFFDGVHIGHRKLISECIACAKRDGLQSAVFTFPLSTPNLKGNKPRIYADKKRAELFAELGIDYLIICDFKLVMGLSPRDFVTRVLCYDLGVRVALSGEGFRFGCGATGGIKELKELMEELSGYAVTVNDVRALGKTVSTTEIRDALANGDMKSANLYLGEPFTVSGKVERGRGVGAAFGFPTVNIELPEPALLKRGVYKSFLKIDGKEYTGLTNIGTCPTFEERKVHSETMILNFAGELYGKHLDLRLIEYIREEKKFATPEALGEQIKKDVEVILNGRQMD